MTIDLTDEHRIWLRYALDAALTDAQGRLPYARAQAEQPKATPKRKTELAAIEARIAAFRELTELLK